MNVWFLLIGCLGFLGFEVGRRYFRIYRGEKILKYYKFPEVIIVIAMTLFSGFFAFFFAEGFKSAFYIGLSSPVILKSVSEGRLDNRLGGQGVKDNMDDEIDDIEWKHFPSKIKAILFYLNKYFG